MNQAETFHLCGGSLPSIGFGTPVFTNKSSNLLWVQSINDKEKVVSFLSIGQHMARQVMPINLSREQKVGADAIYAFSDNANQVHIGSRSELGLLLRSDFAFSPSPHIKRSIAQFLNEPKWIAEAEREIRVRKRARRRSRNLPRDHVLSELLQAVGRSRNREAFASLFQIFAPRIKVWMIHNGATAVAAEEAAQETMLTVWWRASSFDSRKTNAGTWIFTIARNHRIDTLQGRPTAKLALFPEEPHYYSVEEAENTLAAKEMAAASAIELLPPKQVDVVRRVYLEGRSYAEVAKVLNLPLGTVKSRLRLAIARLRDLLAEQY